jgi:hypothetical protein
MTGRAPRFLLLGDSHAGPVGRAAAAASVPFAGGPILRGGESTDEFVRLRAGDVTFRAAEADRRYRGFLAELGTGGLGGLPVPLVSTFGVAAHSLAATEHWRLYWIRGTRFAPGFLAGGLFAEIVRAMAREALEFYRHVRELGVRVLAVLPPQRVPDTVDAGVFVAAQRVLRDALTALGVEIVDPRPRATGPDGWQRPEFCQDGDPVHGNLEFGRLILADLLARGL